MERRMRTYITSFNLSDGRVWSGPDIQASSWQEAERINEVEYGGMYYIHGERIMSIKF